MQTPDDDRKEDSKPGKKINLTDHLANERTFLAWIRTCIGIMAFGFVVVKFSLFIRQLSILVGKEFAAPRQHHSSLIGILLVGLGSVMLLLSFIRYKRTERSLAKESYEPSSMLTFILTITILVLSVGLILYLIESSSSF
ncbi:MAG TPA: DUF202 domain-containing protein [Cyclobacteriaceae bacterium]|nr:DUF202 domain-containing protein [Cyclobacteriaceae bacterium]